MLAVGWMVRACHGARSAGGSSRGPASVAATTVARHTVRSAQVEPHERELGFEAKGTTGSEEEWELVLLKWFPFTR